MTKNELSNTDVTAFANAFVKQIQNMASDGAISSKSPVTFEQAYNITIERKYSKGHSANTIKNFRGVMKQLLPFLMSIMKDNNLELVTVQDMNKYIVTLREKQLQPSTINSHITQIRTLFKTLIINGLIDKDPTIDFGLDIVVKKHRRILTISEIKRVFYSFDLRKKTHFLCNMIFLIHNDTACRVSELCEIRIEDINMKTSEIIYNAFKNKVEVRISLSPITIIALQVYLQEVHKNKKSGVLFVKTERNGREFSNEKLTTSYIRDLYREAGERAGLDFILNTHIVRRTFVTRAIEQGADISLVQKLVGHKDIKSTSQYVHFSKKTLRKAHSEFGTLNCLVRGDLNE